MGEKSQFAQHPIHLEEVRVRELYIKANTNPEDVDENQEIKYSINVGHSEYDDENKQIIVGILFEIKKEEKMKDEPPYLIKVEVFSLFSIDERNFNQKHVYDWARRNAPFILLPYLREQVYALTTRLGYKPFILPLFQVPTFQLEKAIDGNSEE